jgi:all-trans-retinol 13,14-reductase
MKNLYSHELAGQHFDTIIIGSGLGGLTTAVFLAKAGQKVLVLEKHYVPGGFTHTFKRKKFEWDVGVHYVGQVNQEDSILYKVFDFVSEGKLKWTNMGEVYDQANIKGDVYDFKTGRENQINQMIAYFPKEEKAIREYYELIQKVGGLSILFFSERTMPLWLSKSVGYFMRRGFYKYARKTTYEVLKGLTDDEKLISVLCSQCGNYGLPPKQSSFAIHAIVTDHFVEGGNYPVGGASSIAKSLLDVLESHGGKMAIKASVGQILIEKNKAIGVEMENGDKIFASNIVSNAGVHTTYRHLIPSDKSKSVQALRNLGPSVSHFCLYVGLNESDETLQLPKHNIWLYTDYNFDEEYARALSDKNNTPCLAYISFPSAKDPLWPLKHPKSSTIQVVASCPYEWVKEWENGKWQKRGADYEAFKEKMKELLLERLLSVLPHLKDHIELCELSTPLSTKHFSNYAQGEIYGLAHTTDRFAVKQLRATTAYKNIYLTGQDIVCVGVGAALFSGLITSIHILKFKAFKLLKAMMFPVQVAQD